MQGDRKTDGETRETRWKGKKGICNRDEGRCGLGKKRERKKRKGLATKNSIGAGLFDYRVFETHASTTRRFVSFRNIDSGTKRVEKERKKKNFQAAGRNRRMKLNRISPRTSFVDSLPLFFFLSPSSFSKLISRFVKTIVG